MTGQFKNNHFAAYLRIFNIITPYKLEIVFKMIDFYDNINPGGFFNATLHQIINFSPLYAVCGR